MPFMNKYKLAAMLFFLIATTVPLFAGIYLADPDAGNVFGRPGRKKAGTDPGKRSVMVKDRVYLFRDSSLTVNNCRLNFRGIDKDVILLDIYLLELDPDYAYANRIPKKEARDGIRLGDSRFRLLSAGKNGLTMRISGLYNTH